MIKNLKYRLSAAFGGWKLRAYCAVIMALITFAATTLLDTSVNTVKVYDGEQTYVTRTLSPNVATVLASLNLKSESYNVVSAVNDEDTTTINNEKTVALTGFLLPSYKLSQKCDNTRVRELK